MSERKHFNVLKVSAEDVCAQLPVIEEFNPASGLFDILIIAAGFEGRVTASVEKLLAAGNKASPAVLVGKYATNEGDNEEKYKVLKPLLLDLGSELIEFNAEDAISTNEAISAALGACDLQGIPKVAFDVSGASSTLILSVMSSLVAIGMDVELTIIYATASEYLDKPQSPGQADAPTVLERESGVTTVSRNPLCKGEHHDHLPALVIALPSMYTSRLKSCLSHLDVGPMTGAQDNLHWILPSTTTDVHAWRQRETRAAVEDLIRSFQGRDEPCSETKLADSEFFTCDVMDYLGCMKLILRIVDSHPRKNISVVHMGSKMQALGVALAVAGRSEIAVVTARPASFNAKSYSEGVGAIYSVTFSSLWSAVSLVASVGTLSVEGTR